MDWSEIETVSSVRVPLTSADDVVLARHGVRQLAVSIGLDLVAQTKIVTAASELARNVLVHGNGGEVELSQVRRPSADEGIRLTFSDSGPGIDDLELAMTSGWTSGAGLGLGLPGSRRLVHDFEIASAPNTGTTVTVVVWRRWT